MRGSIAFFLAAVWLGMAGCEGRQEERVIGDFGSQPPTTITALTKGESVDMQPVIESAKRAAAPLGESVWPEPSRIVERETAWDVGFDYRPKLVEVDGKQVVRQQLPSVFKVEVQKSDLSARLIPGR